MMFNGGKMSNRILPYLLPDYVLPYALHLLSHDMDLTRHDNVDALLSIRECIWFVLEPLVKGRGYSYDFFRKMIEYIKQCKDATDPEDEQTNLKMYAVCDLVSVRRESAIARDRDRESESTHTEADSLRRSETAYTLLTLILP